MREWLTIIIILLIVTVVLDGVRRMRNNRRNALRMSRRMPKGGDTSRADLETYGSELPNGGARVATVREQEKAKEFHENLRQNLEEKKRQLGRPRRIPEQVSLNLDEKVPTLMDSVQQEPDDPPPAQHHPEDHSQPSGAALKTGETSAHEPRSETEARAPQPSGKQSASVAQTRETDIWEGEDDGRIEPRFDEAELTDAVESQASQVPTAETDPTEAQEASPPANAEPQTSSRYEPEPVTESGDDRDEADDGFAEPEDVIVINVMAPKGERFDGGALRDVLLGRGLRFGTMNIFHHHEGEEGDGGVLYSLANIVKPGTFDITTMDQFSTPGVSLFLTLPAEADSQRGFAAMVTTAKTLSRELGGELKDENRSVLTQQTIEHYRSRIKEFERKQLSRAGA